MTDNTMSASTVSMSGCNRVLVLGAILLLLAAAGGAQPQDTGASDNTSDQGPGDTSSDAPDGGVSFGDLNQDMLDDLAQQYNSEYAHRVPRPIAVFISDERANLHIEMEDSEETVYGVKMDGVEVNQTAVGGIDRPTVEVYTSENTLNEIIAAERPRDRAVQAYKEDDIRYEAHGFLRSLQMRIATGVITLFG